MLSVTYKPLNAECRYAERHYAERHYAERHYAECHYAECHGAFKGRGQYWRSLSQNVKGVTSDKISKIYAKFASTEQKKFYGKVPGRFSFGHVTTMMSSSSRLRRCQPVDNVIKLFDALI